MTAESDPRDVRPAAPFTVVEASIAELRAALESGAVTSEQLVERYLARIAHYDSAGIRLNAVPVLDPRALEAARESDRRRAEGRTLSPLDGIPYTAKDSYKAEGLTVAAGSPAFEHLRAGGDAFTIERLRAAGAVLIGLTTMPPMANGGMQRGVYGRAESPYNADFLPAAYASGSSNGSGVATAASFAAFGLAEETWSSGRSPASNNGLVAYTPSRGVISVRGNWPLVPTMDVVVPHTRTVADLLEVLDVVVADDPEVRGDFWRVQPWVELPAASAVRPASYRALAGEPDPADAPPEPSGGLRETPSARLLEVRSAAQGETPSETVRATPPASAALAATSAPSVTPSVAQRTTLPLAGTRFGVPRMYINRDVRKRVPIETRHTVIELWEAARRDLEALGAEVVECDFPVVENYEEDRPGRHSMYARGLVPAEFAGRELWDLSIWAWNDFLEQNADPALHRLVDVDGPRIFPRPDGQLPDRWGDLDYDLGEYVVRARRDGITPLTDIPTLAEGLRGLEETRRVDFEDWMSAEGFDAVVFPAAADVGPSDADVNVASADLAWRDGVWVSNGNLVPRHLGIPTVTVPMGVLRDIRMPVGLTFAGRAYDDTALLKYAAVFERSGTRRVAPPRTPPLPAEGTAAR